MLATLHQVVAFQVYRVATSCCDVTSHAGACRGNDVTWGSHIQKWPSFYCFANIPTPIEYQTDSDGQVAISITRIFGMGFSFSCLFLLFCFVTILSCAL